MLGRVYERAADFDIIHSHTDYLSLPHARSVATPTVLTLHGRLDIPELAPLYALYDELPLISISDAQRRPLPHANWVATVYHGLPAAAHRFSPVPGDALVFLGRISPEKRPDVAIRVARRAGIRLRIAAKVDAADRVYFEQEIRPLLNANDPLIEFIGEVDEQQKIELLAQARALLFPIPRCRHAGDRAAVRFGTGGDPRRRDRLGVRQRRRVGRGGAAHRRHRSPCVPARFRGTLHRRRHGAAVRRRLRVDSRPAWRRRTGSSVSAAAARPGRPRQCSG
jgi:hypothetical protein